MQRNLTEKEAAEKAFLDFLRDGKKEILFALVSCVFAGFLVISAPFFAMERETFLAVMIAAIVMTAIDVVVMSWVLHAWFLTIGKTFKFRGGRINKGKKRSSDQGAK